MHTFRFGSGRNPVRLIGINAPFEPKLQFGREYQSSANPRQEALQHSPFVSQDLHGRGHNESGIKQPLPQRQQTILSHQLSPQLQQQLRGGSRFPNNSGRSEENHSRGYPRLETINTPSTAAAANSTHAQRGRICSMYSVPHISGQMAMRPVYF